jgi:hypothetical protein
VALTWEQLTIDALEPRALAAWWSEVLAWQVTVDSDDEVEIRSAPDCLPGILFVPVRDDRSVKNRLHLDLRPDDQSREVVRLLAMGARRVDIGQGDVTWVVLADPEDNEFCVLRSR